MANANSHSSSSWAQLDTAPDCEPAGARLCAEHQPQQLKNPEAAGEFQPSALRSRCGWSATQPRSGGSVKMRPSCHSSKNKHVILFSVQCNINNPIKAGEGLDLGG